MTAPTRPPAKQALQLKLTLRHTTPAIWRRILVADNLTFWDLHVAIQDAMGWNDTHLHQFEVREPGLEEPILIGVPDGERMTPVRAGWEVVVSTKLTGTASKIDYLYDFGDDWLHAIVLEKKLPLDDGPYPRCIAGAMRCPPEDCGGVHGYARLLETLADPESPEHVELLEWAGGPIDPKAFDPSEVVFNDPDKALEYVLESFG